MEQVIWRDIVGYEGYYQVSNMGQVRSLDMYLTCRNGSKRLQNHTKCKMLYQGLREAERILHLDHKSALNVLKGKQRQTKGYALCYAGGGDA